MSETNSTVEYRAVKGFPGYRVGDDGSIWSCRHRIFLGYPSFGCRTVVGTTWRRRKLAFYKDGRSYITLWLDNIPYKFTVSRLVLAAFIGPCPPGMECCHFPDRNTANNKLSNLRWDTKKANRVDMIAHRTDQRGERHGMAKLTESDVRAIRLEYAHGQINQTNLGLKYGVSQVLVSKIVCRRLWKLVL